MELGEGLPLQLATDSISPCGLHVTRAFIYRILLNSEDIGISSFGTN